MHFVSPFAIKLGTNLLMFLHNSQDIDILPKSQVEKNLGAISIITPSSLLERSLIVFAIGLSSVPKYFIIILLDIDMTV